MPIARFICPDQVEIEIASCLETCRLGTRCAPKPVLMTAKNEREHVACASASMAGKGARQIVLEAFQPYSIDPRSMVWAFLGISTHLKFNLDEDSCLSEASFQYPEENPFVTGRLDFYDKKEQILYDYKVWGSYKIQKLMTNDEEAWHDVRLQLNAYRIMLQEKGYPVKQMVICAIPRDGGTYISKQRGVDESIYMIRVPEMNPDHVKTYYRRKTEQIRKAYETGHLPNYCTKQETWNGRKCNNGYCRVAEYCVPPWLDLKKRRQKNG